MANFVLGVMVPDLQEQLGYLNLSVPKLRTLDILQDHADAISRLYIHGILTESETLKARKRLSKDIQNLINQKEKKDACNY
jgi:hypothetical protein